MRKRFFHQDYIDEIEYIIPSQNNVTYMFVSFSTNQIVTTQTNDVGTFTIVDKKKQDLIKPEIIALAFSQLQSIYYRVSLPELFEAFDSYRKNKTRYKLAEEILKRMDDKLKMKIFENQYLGKIFISSLVKIKEYLEKRNIKYKWEAFVWQDIEEPKLEENIISLKIDYNNNKEKRKIWRDISSIVEKEDKEDISFITEIKKL